MLDKILHKDLEIEDSRRAIDKMTEKVVTQRNAIDSAKLEIGRAHPDPERFLEDESWRQLCTPWANERIQDARRNVFLKALNLHQSFIFRNADTFQKGLMATMDIVKGVAPKDLPEATRKAAWTTLTFVVPLISTTFASFDRVFHNMGARSLGMVLIDEAGQALSLIHI